MIRLRYTRTINGRPHRPATVVVGDAWPRDLFAASWWATDVLVLRKLAARARKKEEIHAKR